MKAWEAALVVAVVAAAAVGGWFAYQHYNPPDTRESVCASQRALDEDTLIRLQHWRQPPNA